jgi:hypothetical protein
MSRDFKGMGQRPYAEMNFVTPVFATSPISSRLMFPDTADRDPFIHERNSLSDGARSIPVVEHDPVNVLPQRPLQFLLFFTSTLWAPSILPVSFLRPP